MIEERNGKIVYCYDAETLWIEPWGENSLRVRSTYLSQMPEGNWAFIEKEKKSNKLSGKITSTQTGMIIQNGKIKARLTNKGKLFIYNDRDDLLLEEYVRNRRDVTDEKCSAIEVEAREFKPMAGGNYHLTVRFETVDPNEKIYGMGQYQQPFLNLMGSDLELAQRNSQASVPFALSSRGYGMLWNNPGVGRTVFGKNIVSWEAYSTNVMDYWVTAGDSPGEIEESYAKVTGTVPMMPEYGLGFWQCKLRYQTQEELLEIAREYKRREIPIDVIVVDFFHWPKQGEWKFDPVYWPDPETMVKELKDMGIELMVSIWPTVDHKSENYEEMLEKGYLIRTERGFRIGMDFEGNTIHFDATNPNARKYVWEKVRKNYYDIGIRIFWLDEAEPEYSVYDFDNYRYDKGTNLQVGNCYPLEYAKAFYEGMEQEGQENIVNLLRCAWAGSQKYGALVWSGDIASSFISMRNQLAAGLNMGIAGIPWWTTDIGGFHGGNPQDESFRELFVRWFQWGTFCPVMRLHGDREPKQPQHGASGGATCLSGAPNEVWSYGESVYEICKRYIGIREMLRNYTRNLMKHAHEKGTPVMRTLFYEFPDDTKCWEIEDEYMYGEKYLVAPILNYGMRKRKVYLPKDSSWKLCFMDSSLGERKIDNIEGGNYIEVDTPITYMPVFERV